jgi:hypothetical protein
MNLIASHASRVRTGVGALLATLALVVATQGITAESASAMKADANSPYCTEVLRSMAFAYEFSDAAGDWIYANLYVPACGEGVEEGEIEIEEPGPIIWG